MAGRGADARRAGATPVHITVDANCHAYPPPGDPIGSDAVSCDTADVAGGIDRVEINLGDGDDIVQIIAADVPIVINGGDGNDTFYDTDRTNVTLPVPRTFNGGLGDDLFVAGVDSGQPNDYHGDAGMDTMRYTWRSDAPVKRSQTITLDDVADDGENNEGDNVHSDIEYAFGSDQADASRAPLTPTTWSATAAPTRSTATAATTGCSPTTRTTRRRRSATPTWSTAARVPTRSRWAGTRRRTAERATTLSAPSRSLARGGDVVNGGEGQDTATVFDLPALVPDREGAEGQPRRGCQRWRRRPQQLRRPTSRCCGRTAAE